MIKKCELCGKEFETNNPTQAKYCSTECKQKIIVKNNIKRRSLKRIKEWEQNSKNKKCLVCGKEFETKLQFSSQKYCSSICRKRAEKIFGNKEQLDLDYHNNKMFGGNKFKVLERDNYKCQLCGNKSQLVVHHSDFSGQSENANNDMDNLITLCRSCHAKIHSLSNRLFKR